MKSVSQPEDGWDSHPYLRLGFSWLFVQPDKPLGDSVGEAQALACEVKALLYLHTPAVLGLRHRFH